MRSARRLGESLTFGGRVPSVVGLLLVLVVAASIAGALLDGVRALTAFTPASILQGQAWRLVTWTFVETQPIDLVFAALMIYWLGRDLSFELGERGLVLAYLGLSAGSAAATTLLSLVWPSLLPGSAAWLGAWPVIAALSLGWGLLFPDRQILFYMVLPVTGRVLVWVTLGGTFLFILFSRSVGAYVPHLAAEGLMALYLRWPRGRRSSRRPRSGFFDRFRRGRFKVIHVDRDPDSGDKPRWLN
jgi:membrane associated rhomboid family serine protease